MTLLRGVPSESLPRSVEMRDTASSTIREFPMTDETDNPFLTIDETAELLRVNRRTLDNLRWQDDGPPFRRHGGRIVYHRDDVLAWSERRRARTPMDRHNEAPTPRNGRPAPASVPQGEHSDASLECQP